MFFLLRSTLCIGLVVAALPSAPGGAVGIWSLGGSGAHVGPAALEAMTRFCAEHPDRCLQIARDTGAEVRPEPASGRRKLRPVAPAASQRT